MKDSFRHIKGKFTFPRIYKDMIRRFPTGSCFVEIGSQIGKSLSYLLEKTESSGKEINIFSVDFFLGEDGKRDLNMRDKFWENMTPFIGKFEMIESLSWDASKRFRDSCIDFVFIDASHNYKDVKKDILAWLPKIRSGGVMAGHDYSSTYCGVIEAVGEIFGDKVNLSYLDESCWMVEL